MTKGSIGKKVKLVSVPVKGKRTSGNGNIGLTETFTITGTYNPGNSDTAWSITTSTGGNAGWIYDSEIAGGITKEEIQKEIETLECQINDEKLKLSWMEEVGTEEYDEDQFKVYKTLKLLEDGETSLVEKSKLIAELIRGGNC